MFKTRPASEQRTVDLYLHDIRHELVRLSNETGLKQKIYNIKERRQLWNEQKTAATVDVHIAAARKPHDLR